MSEPHRAITAEQANAIYDVLVAEVSAPEGQRDMFVYHQTAGRCDEYRFGGTLGFGGKFWRTNGKWYVTCYPEDRTLERDRWIELTNARLAELHGQRTEEAA